MLSGVSGGIAKVHHMQQRHHMVQFIRTESNNCVKKRHFDRGPMQGEEGQGEA